MKQVPASTALVNMGTNQLAPHYLWELAARVFQFRADRWKRRGLFYKRYREYFPRVSTSRFVDRCLELDVRYRKLSEILRSMSRQGRFMETRRMIMREKHGRTIMVPSRPAIV